jgi:zinc carboxypeptidase
MAPPTPPTPLTAVPGWLAAEIDSVPPIDAFATVDELADAGRRLAAAHPGAVRLHRVGTSAQGEPLTCLTVDGGPGAPEALVFGLPHPNEPIGGLTAVHLAQRLAADADLRARLGHTWRIVACIDPDGLRLNEGWLKGPFTREHYARHFYRQAGHEQIEWTFPLDHKGAYFDAVLPETLALMRLIDAHRPALMASLHNSELGGAYYYLSRAEPALYPVLQEVPARLGVPLHRGEPEAPWIPRLAAGIFRSLDIRDAYDHLERDGLAETVSGGNSTGSYAERHGTLTLVSELPYWSDPRIADTTPTDLAYGEPLRVHGRRMADLGATMAAVLAEVEGATSVESPFLRASRYYARIAADLGADMLRRADRADPRRRSTVAEQVSTEDAVHMFRLRYGGMLLRALDAEHAVGNLRPAVRRARAGLAGTYAGWCAEAALATPAETIPIRSLVATQYAAVAAAAAHLAGAAR